VVDAARRAGVKKIVFLSFLRARPDCGSGYHESKWAAEEIVRSSNLDYTVIKAAMIYGRGDHMLDHVSHMLCTLPVFAAVGFKEQPVRPVAIEDAVSVLVAALVGGRLSQQTVAVTGPETLPLSEAVKRIGQVLGKRVLVIRLPTWLHYALAWSWERFMVIPIISVAQVRMLSEGIAEPMPPCDSPPNGLRPSTPFALEQIRKHMPEPAPFQLSDFRLHCANR
jgi:NADH dehydrogenase